MDDGCSTLGSSAALTGRLVEHDGARGGDVQRADAAGHGNAQQVVAGATHKIVEAGALPAEDEDAVAGEIELIVVGGAALIESNDPDVLPLQFFESTDEVDDARDAQMLCCSGARLHSDRTERSRTPLGENNAVNTGAVGDAEQCAEVLRIFNTIEREQEPGCIGAGRPRGKEVLQCHRFLRADEGYHSLMSRCACQLRELVACFLADTDAGLAALGDQMGQALVVALTGNQNVIEAATASLESLFDGMEAVDNFHEGSLED